MNWFNGPITEAIAKCKSDKLIFMVYVFDSNSKEMTDLWLNDQVASLISKECVALQLEASSEACKQFSEFYKILCYPTTYFIDENGVPIEVIAGSLSLDQLLHKLNKIITEFNAKKIPSNHEEEVTVSTESQNSKSLEQKVAEAKEKIRLLQEKKAKEEEDKLRQQEIERRKMGQELLKMKQQKEQEEAKRLAEDKKRERQQEELAKKKVLEKIQQDREEKKRKYDEEKERIQKEKDEERRKVETEQEAKRQLEAAQRSSIARIQFRLTDGSTIIEQFNPDQTLNEVMNLLSDRLKEINYPNRGFALHSTYPKRVFGNEHMNVSLRELQLAPTASLLIMPTRSHGNLTSAQAVLPSSSNIFDYIQNIGLLILMPVTLLWNFVRGIFTPTQQTQTQTTNQETSQQFIARKREEQMNLRKRSNIGSIHDRSNNDDDDKNATWNGNSTQQM